MQYGLDFDLFFREVGLRAKNNYGNWQTEEEARGHVSRAYFDTFADLQDAASADDKYGQLVSEMLEQNDIKK